MAPEPRSGAEPAAGPEPDGGGDTSRGMAVTMLWRLEGSPSYVGVSQFADVSNEDWYAQAVRWADAEGIVNGFTENENKVFNPNGAVTREQLAVMLYRYAKYKSMNVKVIEDTNTLNYSDAASAGSYAAPAMQWAVGSGIINGYHEDDVRTLRPNLASSRAVVANMLMRYCKNAEK